MTSLRGLKAKQQVATEAAPLKTIPKPPDAPTPLPAFEGAGRIIQKALYEDDTDPPAVWALLPDRPQLQGWVLYDALDPDTTVGSLDKLAQQPPSAVALRYFLPLSRDIRAQYSAQVAIIGTANGNLYAANEGDAVRAVQDGIVPQVDPNAPQPITVAAWALRIFASARATSEAASHDGGGHAALWGALFCLGFAYLTRMQAQLWWAFNIKPLAEAMGTWVKFGELSTSERQMMAVALTVLELVLLQGAVRGVPYLREVVGALLLIEGVYFASYGMSATLDACAALKGQPCGSAIYGEAITIGVLNFVIAAVFEFTVFFTARMAWYYAPCLPHLLSHAISGSVGVRIILGRSWKRISGAKKRLADERRFERRTVIDQATGRQRVERRWADTENDDAEEQQR